MQIEKGKKADTDIEASRKDPADERFFAIKIRQQRYLGKSAIVIFIRDRTKKIKAQI